MDLALKHDTERAFERLEAWWVGDVLDRPPITLQVKPTKPDAGPTAEHANHAERWMDVPHVVESALAQMQRRCYLAETFPIFNPNLGPDITGTLFGCQLEFGQETSWATPVVHDVAEWDVVMSQKPDFKNRYWQTIEALTDYALDRLAGQVLVGMTDLHGSYDLLVSLRDPQMLCLDLMDDREAVDRAARAASRAFVASFERQYRKLASAGYGATCWASIYHAGPAYVPSCDFWCMIDGDSARELVFPRLVEEMKPLDHSIFHLDGPDALRHLELVLELPGLNAVQWVFGAGNGPASNWLEPYRRCRAVDKSIEVLAETPADAIAVLEELGPGGLWLFIEEEFESEREAKAFIDEVAKAS